METKHTPGPWRIKESQFGGIVTWSVNFGPIGTMDYCEVSGPSAEANARLIAAAPETAAERDELKAWKEQSIFTTQPLFDFMQSHKDLKVGDSITQKAIEFIKERDILLGTLKQKN